MCDLAGRIRTQPDTTLNHQSRVFLKFLLPEFLLSYLPLILIFSFKPPFILGPVFLQFIGIFTVGQVFFAVFSPNFFYPLSKLLGLAFPAAQNNIRILDHRTFSPTIGYKVRSSKHRIVHYTGARYRNYETYRLSP